MKRKVHKALGHLFGGHVKFVSLSSMKDVFEPTRNAI